MEDRPLRAASLILDLYLVRRVGLWPVARASHQRTPASQPASTGMASIGRARAHGRHRGAQRARTATAAADARRVWTSRSSHASAGAGTARPTSVRARRREHRSRSGRRHGQKARRPQQAQCACLKPELESRSPGFRVTERSSKRGIDTRIGAGTAPITSANASAMLPTVLTRPRSSWLRGAAGADGAAVGVDDVVLLA